jgi:hypothetical protein
VHLSPAETMCKLFVIISPLLSIKLPLYKKKLVIATMTNMDALVGITKVYVLVSNV